jgi:hypothetical protein
MSDYLSARQALVLAVDELDAAFAPAGTPNLTAQLASLSTANSTIASLTSQRDAANTLATNRRAVIDGMVIDLNAADVADAAEQAADSAGDAARAAAKAKAQAAT